MTTIPTFAPLKVQGAYDQVIIKNELLSNNIFEHSIVATTVYQNGKSMWQPDGVFADNRFNKVNEIPHYDVDSSGNRTLVNGKYNTFQTVNLTVRDDYSKQESWEGTNTVENGKVTNGDRVPLWIKYKHPWKFRDDLKLPYTYKVLSSLPFEYIQTVRCVMQQPPSIGVVHADSGPTLNKQYFDDGFASITLNIDAGQGHLWFFTESDKQEHSLDESKWDSWHFDDSCRHCTTEIYSPRIQLRAFGKLQSGVSYLDLLDLEHAIW